MKQATIKMSCIILDVTVDNYISGAFIGNRGDLPRGDLLQIYIRIRTYELSSEG